VLLGISDGSSSSSSWWGFRRKLELGDVTSQPAYARGKKILTDSAMLSNLDAAAADAAAAAVAAPAAPPLPNSPSFSFRSFLSSARCYPPRRRLHAEREQPRGSLHPPDSIGAAGRRRREPQSGGGGGGEQMPAQAPSITMRRERSWISEEPRLSVKIKTTLDQARPRLPPPTTTMAHVSTLGVDTPQERQLLSPRKDEPSAERHDFSLSSVGKSANVVPAERLAFFVAPPVTTSRFVERGDRSTLFDADACYRHASRERSLDKQLSEERTLLARCPGTPVGISLRSCIRIFVLSSSLCRRCAVCVETPNEADAASAESESGASAIVPTETSVLLH
jgi:hypothetical protein